LSRTIPESLRWHNPGIVFAIAKTSSSDSLQQNETKRLQRFSDFKRGQFAPIVSREYLDKFPLYVISNSSNSENLQTKSISPLSEISLQQNSCNP